MLSFSKSIVASLVFFRLAVAAPTTTGNECGDFISDFDDVRASTTLRIYDGLNFTHFTIPSSPRPGQPGGIVAQSPQHAAAFGPVNSITAGTITLPHGSSLQSFDLSSFFFGCSDGNLTTSGSSPVPCVIEVSGSKATGASPKKRHFSFKPEGNNPARMAFANFQSTFLGVESVEISLARSPAADKAVTILVDNFAHYNEC